jgi:nitrate/nitrite-specific signal transduction histidine kinase
LLLYAITAAAVAAVFSTALLINWYSTISLVATDDNGIRTYQNLTALQSDEEASNARVITYLIDTEPGALAEYRAAIAARDQSYARLERDAQGGTVGARIGELAPLYIQLDTLADRLIADPSLDATGKVRTWQQERGRAEATIGRQYALIVQAAEAEHDSLVEIVLQTRIATIALTFIFATATALLGLWVTRKVILNITKPLEALAEAAAAIGAGKLETRVAPGLAAEFDMLGGVMNTMAGRLAESRDDLQEALALAERRNHELRLLSEVGDALDSSLDLDLIVERSLAVVAASFGAHDGAVILYDEDGESWRWRASEGPDEQRDRAPRAAALRRAIADPHLEQHRIMILPTVDTQGETGEMLAITLLDAAVRNHGVLALFAPAGWSVDPRQRALLEQVGGQIARAIENVQLYAAEKGRSAEAGMLAQMAQLTTGTLDLDRLARLIARYAVHVLGVERCIIGFFDPRGEIKGRGTLQRLYQYGFQPQQEALIEGERASLQAIVRRHMLEGQTLVVADAWDDQRPEVAELAQRLDVRSFISVPLIARGRRLGLIYLDTKAPRQHSFGPQDQRILAAIADQAAAAIDGARLFEAERRRGAELRVLNQAGQQVAATTQLDRLFDSVITTIRESFGYARVQIGLIEDDHLILVAGQDQHGATEREHLALESDHPAATVARQGIPRRVRREDGGDRNQLLVPLRAEDTTVGVLAVAGGVGSRCGPFDADDERLLLALGDQLGIAVEKNRLQERTLALAVVAERNRLARDLHDSVTQSLFSINLTIEATRMLLRRDTDAAERQLINLSERTKETLAEMRHLIYSLRPAEMEDQGLVAALKRWGERVRHEHLLPVEVIVEPGPRPQLSELGERELFRVAQEALNNVLKHARATQARVRLGTSPVGVTLSIEDNGIGFDTTAPLRADSFGTRGMRERVALLGGDLEILSTFGEGTRIIVTLPPLSVATTSAHAAGAEQTPAGHRHEVA